MTYGQAIVTVKSLNSPDPTADLAEKFEAIKKITEMATINSLTKADLMRCVKWLLERSEAANDRLTAYEDTGMEPEDILSATDMGKVACALHELNRYKDLGDWDRLRELSEADRAGRCVVLRCKEGDTIYVVGSKKIVKAQIQEMYLLEMTKDVAYMVFFDCDDDCQGCPFNSWYQSYDGEWSCDGEYGNGTVNQSEIGKTVFLTQEAAEAALKQKNE